MNCGTGLWATFVGSLLAFCFGILLFYISESIRKRLERSDLLKGLQKEFDFNFKQIDSWIRYTQEVQRRIAADDHRILGEYRLTDFQRLFVQMCFQRGVLYDALEPSDLTKLNAILLHFDYPTTRWLNDHVEAWNQSSLSKSDANSIFEYEVRVLEGHKTDLQEMLDQLKSR